MAADKPGRSGQGQQVFAHETSVTQPETAGPPPNCVARMQHTAGTAMLPGAAAGLPAARMIGLPY
jgi:hypothetical protein